MRVYKDTPFEFGLMPWELDPPNTVVLFFIKGTFDLVHQGTARISDEQVLISGEVPYDDAEIPSVLCESDFALRKPRGEWLLRGTAHAVGGRPVTLVPVTVRVGELEKSLVVYGDRVWQRGVLGAKPSNPQPFTSMPLRWERSFGGPKVNENPSGMGTTSVETKQGRVDPLPNIEDPRRPLLSKEDRPPPAGMFAIPSTWPARSSRMGTFDEHWKRSRWPFFPLDFDFDFYQSAPVDQRRKSGHWRGDERIVLKGLHPEQAVIDTRLPGIAARCFIEWATPPASAAGSPSAPRPRIEPSEALAPATQGIPRPRLVEVLLVLDTISIDADAMKACCVWRGLLPGVSDERLGNVGKLFIVHEDGSAPQPAAFYEQRLLELIEAEEAEFASPEEPPVDEPALEAELEGDQDEPPARPLTLAAAGIGVFAAIEGLFASVEALKTPSAEKARQAFVDAGLEPPEDLVEPELPEVVAEEQESRSFRRLCAILRYRRRRSFAGEDLTGAPFAKLDLTGADFSGAILTDADLTGARLAGARFEGTVLVRARLSDADLRGAVLDGAELSESDLSRANMTGASMQLVTATHATLPDVVLDDVRGAGCMLEGCDMSRARLRRGLLDRADFSGSRLDGADLTGASLEHASFEGVSARGASFERCRAPDLRASEGADLTEAKLILVEAPRAQLQNAICFRANLSGSNLAGADLSEAILVESNLVRCDLSGAKLGRADLRLASVLQANVFEADFEKADLREADFRGAHLFSAYFFRTRTDGTRFEGAVLGRTSLSS